MDNPSKEKVGLLLVSSFLNTHFLLEMGIFVFKIIEKLERKIKLLWDFRGPDALETAKHHTLHLKEFSAIENLPFHEIDIKELNPMLCAAFIVVNESYMKVFRDALKPHRGELA